MAMTLDTHTHTVREGNFILSLDEVVETIRDDALAQARRKLDALWQGRDLSTLLRRHDFFDYFKYGLASSVAKVLAANDDSVQAVYAYDPSINQESEVDDDLPQDAGVHLLVLVTTPSPALSAFVAALDRALTASLKDLPSPRWSQRVSVLDVNLVTEEDVRRGANYAGLLSGVFAPPLRIWQRA